MRNTVVTIAVTMQLRRTLWLSSFTFRIDKCAIVWGEEQFPRTSNMSSFSKSNSLSRTETHSMSVALPEIRVGDPVRHESLSVFPLFTDVRGDVDYVMSDSAIGNATLLIEEVDQAGSVPDLLVENKGDVRVLLLEGEELIGAKQNRILNTSVLIAAHSKIKIPCVVSNKDGGVIVLAILDRVDRSRRRNCAGRSRNR